MPSRHRFWRPGQDAAGAIVMFRAPGITGHVDQVEVCLTFGRGIEEHFLAGRIERGMRMGALAGPMALREDDPLAGVAVDTKEAPIEGVGYQVGEPDAPVTCQ